MSTWFKKKHLQQHGDMCQFNPILQISFKRNWVNTINIHTMLEGTTQVIIEAIKLACNGVQHSYRYLELRNVHVVLLQLLEDITRRFSKFNKLIRHCILQKIHQQLQTFLKPTGKLPFWPHKISTKFWLAVWRWCNRFLIHKKWRINRTSGGCSHQFS